ncbi:MAG TPA: secretion protein Por [Marinilabiliales bacterium]|nr:secretion protein Por [Marinilabiliales bacterium]
MKLHLTKKFFVLAFISFLGINATLSQNVTITVNAAQGKRAVSPNIYGRNESFDKSVQFYKDAGLRFARVGGGNNMSAYNWRQKLTVHPDWFNNVYGTDWDVYAKKINDNFTNMQGMFAFQLLGRAASTGKNNFGDWAYMQAHPGFNGFGQNLAGGGTPNPNGGSKALVDGNIDLFSKPWPADSSVAILDHWFGANGKGFNKKKLEYWSMDNECDVWNGTHDWAMPTLIPASEFMDRFIELAKKAKAIEPDIKICGPVTTSEWQWYKWSNENIRINGTYYCWFEYFIKRCADEEKASGIRVLDVFDIHHYPYAPTNADALQNHRIFYDKNYNYPGANGLNTINGGWDTSSKKEYVFQRINDWLTKHYGANHGITLGLSEWSPGPDEPNLASVIYATHLGTFANNGVEYFTPWNWFTGMWESIHLFSRYSKKYSVSSTSSLENTVSAYTTVNEAADSMTVIIVNRDMSSTRNVTVNLNGYTVNDGNYSTLQLASLPSTETFISHTNNALKKNSVAITSNSFTLAVPKLSTTAVILKSTPTGISEHKNQADEIKVFPNPANDQLRIRINRSQDYNSSLYQSQYYTLLNSLGQTISVGNLQPEAYEHTINTSSLTGGLYFIKIGNKMQKFTIQH